MKKARRKMEYETYFLNEGSIKFILERMDKNNLKNQLRKVKKYCNIPVKDVEDLWSQLRDTDFLGIERASPLEFSLFPVLDNSGAVRDFGHCQANFDIVNKWGHKRPYRAFQVIYSDDFSVLWFGNILVGEPVFWVSAGNVVCRITYFHKELRVYPNVCDEHELVTDLDPISLDNVAKKYYKRLRYFDPSFLMLEHEDGDKTIYLDEHFKKGFFFKGPKWNYDEYKKSNYYSWIRPSDIKKHNITDIRNVKTENGLFKIEIENNTYPHSGYAYLDLAKLKIVRTEVHGN